MTEHPIEKDGHFEGIKNTSPVKSDRRPNSVTTYHYASVLRRLSSSAS